MLDSLLDLIAVRDSPEFNQMSNSVETKYRMFHIYRVLGEMGGEEGESGRWGGREGEGEREREREGEREREREGERETRREEEVQRRCQWKMTDTGHAHAETDKHRETDRDI